LQYIPWFALGICVYQLSLRKHSTSIKQVFFTAVMAVMTLTIAESALVGAIALTFSALVYGAALGHLRFLNTRLFLWLGSISYPLYLIHENIGWSIQLQALARGVPFYATVLLVLAVSLALATAMTRWIEIPAMRWIRGRYRARVSAVLV
jgi:peptidoglycan/LPS O-acetylase OafA/YrhL